jgi:hypothetical protein
MTAARIGLGKQFRVLSGDGVVHLSISEIRNHVKRFQHEQYLHPSYLKVDGGRGQGGGEGEGLVLSSEMVCSK